MADTGLINPGETTPNLFGGGNGGNDRIIDGDLSTITQAYDFGGATKTYYFHSWSGTDIPSGAVINGVELVAAGRYDPTYTEPDWGSANNYSSAPKWVGSIEAQTLAVKERLKKVYDCDVISINPFINFGLEGHRYTSNSRDADGQLK